MPVFSDFVQALLRPITDNRVAPPTTRAHVPNRLYREGALKKAGYLGERPDHNLFADMDPATAAEIMDLYLQGSHDRVADDRADRVAKILQDDVPPGMLPEGADDPEYDPRFDPAVSPRRDRLLGAAGRATYDPPRVRSSTAQPERFDVGSPHLEPWMLIPKVGDLRDEVVMSRRSQGQPGYEPQDFEGFTEQEAAAAIAAQLKARRIKQMGPFSPDFIDTLPTY
jgi:hypothetical protein